MLGDAERLVKSETPDEDGARSPYADGSAVSSLDAQGLAHAAALAMRPLPCPSAGVSEVRFVLPVWGQERLDFALRFSIPSLLTPRNIPAFARRVPATFLFVTPEDEVPAIANSVAFQRLEESCNCRFLVQPPTHRDGFRDSYSRFTSYYERALCDPDVAVGSTGFVFLTADIIFGDGSLANLAKHVVDGHRAVLVPGPRVALEPFLEEYAKKFQRDGLPALDNRALVQLFLATMHDITRSFVVNDDLLQNDYPIHLYRRLDDCTLVYRNFVYHPLYVRPLRRFTRLSSTIDQAFVPEAVADLSKVYIVKDSDDVFCVDAAESVYDQGFIDSGSIGSAERKRRIRVWLGQGWATAFHLWLASHRGTIHSGDLTSCSQDEQDIDRIVRGIYRDEGFDPAALSDHRYFLLRVRRWKFRRRSWRRRLTSWLWRFPIAPSLGRTRLGRYLYRQLVR